MKKGMKIPMAYDGSEHSMHALNQGASLANITDSVIIILSVIPRIIMPLLPPRGWVHLLRPWTIPLMNSSSR
jgi:nucleotide-binding universal stress UspA family protein